MKVTYPLSTSEYTSWHRRKCMIKEQQFILNHTSNIKKSNLPSKHKWMHKFTQQQVEKRIIMHSFYTCIHLVSKCEPLMKPTYRLSTIESTSSHRSSQRKEQLLILNHTSNPRMLITKTYHLSTSECTSSQAANGEKSNHSFLITHLGLEG